MARKSESGRYIISAAEVGTFVVCPEAWRLREIEKIKVTNKDTVSKGQQLHSIWAAELDDASYLKRATRWIVILIMLAIAIQLLKSQ